MSEKSFQKRIIIAGALAILCASLYAWGGMEEKWLRRYLASAIYIAAIALFKKDPKALIFYPLLVIGLSMGYGADEMWIKVAKRSFVAFVISAGALGAFIVLWRQYVFSFICFIIILCAYVLLGVFNPFSSLFAGARLEEFIIGNAVFSIPLLAASVGGSNDKN